MLQSSNPVLTDQDTFQQYYGDMAPSRSDTTTMQGVVNKTGILVALAVAAGMVGYALVRQYPSIIWISSLASLGIVLGGFFVLRGKPQLAPFIAAPYAIVEGVLLGSLTMVVERIVEQQGYAVTGGVALQAFIITISLMLAMLALYSLRILQPTRTFVAAVSTLTMGVFITYLLSFGLSLFGVQMPFISIFSAANETGTAAWIGLGINVLFLGIAALGLIIDFGMVEENIKAGSPKHMEWYCAFALIVSLAWIYYEALKLVLRLAALFGRE